jgi:hypothetical protein
MNDESVKKIPIIDLEQTRVNLVNFSPVKKGNIL